MGILVGNKSDLKDTEDLSEEALALANEYHLVYIETSCKSGDNIENIFIKMTEQIIEKSQNSQKDEN